MIIIIVKFWCLTESIMQLAIDSQSYRHTISSLVFCHFNLHPHQTIFFRDYDNSSETNEINAVHFIFINIILFQSYLFSLGIKPSSRIKTAIRLTKDGTKSSKLVKFFLCHWRTIPKRKLLSNLSKVFLYLNFWINLKYFFKSKSNSSEYP